MKKCCVVCLFLLFLAVLPAAADIVWTPGDDYFMNTFNPESDSRCTNVERKTFMAAGKDGYVTAVRTPLDKTEIGNYPNGTEFMIDFFCGIGDSQWGTVRAVRLPGEKTFQEDYLGKSGYIAREDLVQAFDTDAFAELNCNSIFGFTDELDPCNPRFPFVIWAYPNSGVQLYVVTEGDLDWFCTQYAPEYFPIRFDRTYTDPDGTKWISVRLNRPYTYGWLNFDHPMDGAIEPIDGVN